MEAVYAILVVAALAGDGEVKKSAVIAKTPAESFSSCIAFVAAMAENPAMRIVDGWCMTEKEVEATKGPQI